MYDIMGVIFVCIRMGWLHLKYTTRILLQSWSVRVFIWLAIYSSILSPKLLGFGLRYLKNERCNRDKDIKKNTQLTSHKSRKLPINHRVLGGRHLIYAEGSLVSCSEETALQMINEVKVRVLDYSPKCLWLHWNSDLQFLPLCPLNEY